jgi:hypothetical protein
MRVTWVVLSPLPLLLSGCTSLYYARPGELVPARAVVASDQRLAVWQRAVTVLLDEGYVPDVLDGSAGFIKAKRRDDLEGDTLARTVALVSVTAQGQVRVEISGGGLFHSEQDFRRAIAERQRRIADRIVDPREAAAEVSRRP